MWKVVLLFKSRSWCCLVRNNGKGLFLIRLREWENFFFKDWIMRQQAALSEKVGQWREWFTRSRRTHITLRSQKIDQKKRITALRGRKRRRRERDGLAEGWADQTRNRLAAWPLEEKRNMTEKRPQRCPWLEEELEEKSPRERFVIQDSWGSRWTCQDLVIHRKRTDLKQEYGNKNEIKY